VIQFIQYSDKLAKVGSRYVWPTEKILNYTVKIFFFWGGEELFVFDWHCTLIRPTRFTMPKCHYHRLTQA